MPVPDGTTLAEAERLLARRARARGRAGAGLTGLTPDPATSPALERLAAALGS